MSTEHLTAALVRGGEVEPLSGSPELTYTGRILVIRKRNHVEIDKLLRDKHFQKFKYVLCPLHRFLMLAHFGTFFGVTFKLYHKQLHSSHGAFAFLGTFRKKKETEGCKKN